MTQKPMAALDVFRMITRPQVTSEGLTEFAAILEDEASARSLFETHTIESTQDFLEALFWTKGDHARRLFVQALCVPCALWSLIENQKSDKDKRGLIEKLDALKGDQLTAVLSVDHTLSRFIYNNFGPWVITKIDLLSPDQVSRIINAEGATEALCTRNHHRWLLSKQAEGVDVRFPEHEKPYLDALLPPPPRGLGAQPSAA